MDVFKTLILDTPDSLDNISGVLPIVNGGTGADNASDARDNLGLGTMATQDADAVAITGGSATGLTSLGVVDDATLGSSNSDTVTFNARIASEFTPATDNTYDLGRVGHEWRDLYLDGTANIDSLVADTADINGDLTVTGEGSFTGNVGVGTTVPSTFRTKVLEVADTNNAGIVINGDAANAFASLRLTNSGTSGWDLNYNFPNVGDLGFFDIGAADTRMVIDDSGNVGIGTTAPSYQLQLSTDSAAKPSTNTWTIVSDSRIKTETGEYTKGLDAVLSLRPVTYRYNGKAGMVDDGEDKISIIAQEAVNAFPECVGSYMTKLDEDDEEETEVLNWNGHALTFALVNSIKELTARLEALENN